MSAHHASIQNRVLRLTPKEFDLLACLARNPERALTHAFLLQHVWGSYYTEQPEALRVLFTEYNKYLVSLVRGALPVHSVSSSVSLAGMNTR